MLTDGVKREIAVTMAAFRKYYDDAVNNKRYGEPQCVADLMCKKLKDLMTENVSPGKKQQRAGALEKLPDEPEDHYMLRVYHEAIIRDILKNIGKGYTDYVYDPLLLFELYAYEPQLAFSWKNGAFFVRKEGTDEA